MKKRFLSLFICFVSSFSFLLAGQTLLTEPIVTVLESSDQGLTLKLSLDDYSFEDVMTDRGIARVPFILKGGNNTEKGSPDLPSVIKSLLIPDVGNVDVRVVSSDYEMIDEITIAPSKGSIYRNENPADIPYVYGAAYQKNEFLPNVLCSVEDPYILRDVRGINIEFNPFVYNPVLKQLKVYKEITVEVKFDDQKSVNELRNSRKSAKENTEFKKIYNRLFLNATNGPKYTPLEEAAPGKLLVIANDVYADAIADYVNWKREKGLNTELVLTSSIASSLTSAVLKNFIQNKYDNEDDLCYILLVGDANDVPTRIMGGAYGDSDYYYACLSGSDGYADAFIGRFSGNSVQDIQTQVERTIYYEKYLNESDTWLANAFGSASNEGAGQGHNWESDVQHMNNIRTDLQNYGYTVTHVNETGGSAAAVSAAFNSGVGVANYIGHGDLTLWVNTYFRNSHVNVLVNENRLPFIWSVACQNGNFRSGTCFAEAWLRATNDEKPTGAIAFLGATIDQSWKEPMDAQDEMVDILVESYLTNIKRTIGGISFNGMFKMIQNGGLGQQMADTWVLFGDPSLAVRTKTPSAMEVDHANKISLGDTHFEVECDAENALVCLSSEDEEGNVEIVSYAYVVDGVASLDFEALETLTPLKLTVTAFDKETIQKELSVSISEGVYIVENGFTIDDSEGNNNGLVDYGERIVIAQSLKNMGVETARNITITLQVENEDIVVEKGTATVAEIESLSLVNIEDCFILRIPNNIEDQLEIPFSLSISDEEGGVWNAGYSIIAHAPRVVVSSVRVDDSLSGNGNMLMNSGETVKIQLNLSNLGKAPLVGNVLLSSDKEYLTIESPRIELGGLETDEVQSLEFDVAVGYPNPLPEEYIDFSLYFNSIDTYYDLSIPINLTIENWESNGFVVYDWDNSSEIPWVIDSAEKHEGYYSAKSGTITNNEKTALVITLDVVEDSTIDFYKKVSCEKSFVSSEKETFYDNLAFYIDNEIVGQWGGEVDWSLESFEVKAGTREFKWEYTKDMSLHEGEDCAWVDDIRFPVNSNYVGLNSIREDKLFRLYPNPARDYVYISGNLTEDLKCDIEIYNINGQRVFYTVDNILSGNRLNLNSFENGYYLVKVSTGDQVYIQKLIINK